VNATVLFLINISQTATTTATTKISRPQREFECMCTVGVKSLLIKKQKLFSLNFSSSVCRSAGVGAIWKGREPGLAAGLPPSLEFEFMLEIEKRKKTARHNKTER
jgi:hypothetical protein